MLASLCIFLVVVGLVTALSPMQYFRWHHTTSRPAHMAGSLAVLAWLTNDYDDRLRTVLLVRHRLLLAGVGT